MKYYTIFVGWRLFIFTTIPTSKAQSDIALLEEAGCGQQGILLEKGVCTIEGYHVEVVPQKGSTKVYSRISKEKVRKVSSTDDTITIEFSLTFLWVDHRIKTSFSGEDREHGGIGLTLGRVNNIWKPDLYIYNLSDYGAFSDSKKAKSLRILSSNPLNVTETVVEYKIGARATVYCNFQLAGYPMDDEKCQFRFGSRSFSFKFVLFDPTNAYHYTKHHKTSEFELITTFVGDAGPENISDVHVVGFDLKMHRILQPFIMKYYLPCIAIVIMSQISFVIPLSAIPGRVALAVTQFLTLTNIFIYQTVSL